MENRVISRELGGEPCVRDGSRKEGMETVACDLCGSDESEVLIRQQDLLLAVTDEEFTIGRCRRCGLIYLNPRPSIDRIGTYYPTVYYPPVPAKPPSLSLPVQKKFSGRMKRWVLEEYYGYPAADPAGLRRTLKRILLWPDKAFREFMGRYPVPWRGEGSVLDVGCGAGGNLKVLQEQGWNVSGIEISSVAAAHAQALVTGAIHTGTLESAPFPPGSFDLILMNHSLEHFPSPLDGLRRARRLLKDDGLLVVSVPNANSFEVKLFGWWWFGWDPPRHFYHFEKNTLFQALSQTGFRPLRYRTGTGAVFLMASLDRFWTHRFQKEVPFRKLIDRFVARPVAWIAGHLGYGTEMTVYASKQQADAPGTSSR